MTSTSDILIDSILILSPRWKKIALHTNHFVRSFASSINIMGSSLVISLSRRLSPNRVCACRKCLLPIYDLSCPHHRKMLGAVRAQLANGRARSGHLWRRWSRKRWRTDVGGAGGTTGGGGRKRARRAAASEGAGAGADAAAWRRYDATARRKRARRKYERDDDDDDDDASGSDSEDSDTDREDNDDGSDDDDGARAVGGRRRRRLRLVDPGHHSTETVVVEVGLSRARSLNPRCSHRRRCADGAAGRSHARLPARLVGPSCRKQKETRSHSRAERQDKRKCNSECALLIAPLHPSVLAWF